MKRLLSVLLVLTMIFAFVSCDKLFGNNGGDEEPGEDTPGTEQPKDDMADVPRARALIPLYSPLLKILRIGMM